VLAAIVVSERYRVKTTLYRKTRIVLSTNISEIKKWTTNGAIDLVVPLYSEYPHTEETLIASLLILVDRAVSSTAQRKTLRPVDMADSERVCSLRS
jgi:hypothetical protein